MRAVVDSLRPRQWIKNVFVFAGLIFANELGQIDSWVSAGACFVAFCAASSAAYLANDVHDVDEDKRHPIKRTRPIASGELALVTARALAFGLLVLSLAIALLTNVEVVLFLLLFIAMQVVYTATLKRLVILDVLTIAGLFVVRAAAGAAAVDVAISTWLLLCTGLLALLLGLAKRRGELLLVEADQAPGRRALDGYSLSFVDQCLTLVAAATVIAYSLYAVESATSGMAVTIPFVVYAVLRYLLLVNLHGWGEEPDRILFEDRPLQTVILLWVLAAAAVLVATGDVDQSSR